jgi:transcriptional regulator with XRE-family HTH domain
MYNRALRLIREYHRLSRTELASRLGLSKSYVSELERGKKPTIDVIERYAETFRIPVSSLLLFAEHSDDPNFPERTRTFTADKVLKMLEWLRDTAAEDNDDCEMHTVQHEAL